MRLNNNKGFMGLFEGSLVPLISTFGPFIVAALIAHPYYAQGKIGAGGTYAQVGKVEFKKLDGTVTTDRSQAWFNQDKP